MPMKKFKLWSWIVCGFLLLFLGATFVFHQFSLRNESELLTPIGKQVTVNGHRMNISVKGEGPQTTLYFLDRGSDRFLKSRIGEAIPAPERKTIV